MKKRPSPIARAFAVLALLASVIVLAVIVIAVLDDSGSSDSAESRAQHANHREQIKHVPATYVIQDEDTLTAIAHATGVSVAKIERLNPEVDPQILIAGEKLKLK